MLGFYAIHCRALMLNRIVGCAEQGSVKLDMTLQAMTSSPVLIVAVIFVEPILSLSM